MSAASRIVRASKFRHVFAEAEKVDNTYQVRARSARARACLRASAATCARAACGAQLLSRSPEHHPRTCNARAL
jgi:hypothetical protein